MKKKILLLLVIISSITSTFARDIIVGVKVQPPFIIESNEGDYSGICIDILTQSFPNDSLIFQKYETYNTLIHACEKNDIDLIASNITMLPERESQIDFSISYFESEIGIVSQTIIVSLMDKARKLLGLLLQFYAIFIGLGLTIFLIEKDVNEAFQDANKDNIRDNKDWFIAIMNGTYFAFIVGSTIGFGDITPKTIKGKFFTMFIFFVSLSYIGYFFTQLTKILADEDVKIEHINQLKDYNVSCQNETTTKLFLEENGIPISETVRLVEQGIINSMGDESRIFVDEKPIVEYYLYKNSLKGKLKVYSNSFMEQSYGFGVPEKNVNKNHVLENLNKKILELKMSKEIEEIAARYGI